MKLYQEGQEGPQIRFQEVSGAIQIDLFDPAAPDFAWTHIGYLEADADGKPRFVRQQANPNLVQVDADGKIVCA